MSTKQLTVIAINAMKPDPTRRLEIRDGGAKGLLLLVHPSGHKSWIMRFRRPDERRPGETKMAKMTLGPFDPAPDMSETSEPRIGSPLTLAAARRLAAEVAHKRLLGIDPISERDQEKRTRRDAAIAAEADSYGILAREFVTNYALKRQRRWKETARLLGLRPLDDGSLSPIPGGLVDLWGVLPVGKIGRRDITTIINETRDRAPPGLKGRRPARPVGKGSPGMSRAMFTALSRFFSWCISELEQEVIERNPCVKANRPPAPKSRVRILDDAEVRAFWAATERLGPPFGPAARLLLLTGLRLSEVSQLRWDEIARDDRGAERIQLPPDRTKNHRPHSISLAPMARQVLSAIPRLAGCTYFFSVSGHKPINGWGKVKKRLDALMEEELGHALEPWRLHDLRRTFASSMARIGVRLEVTEKLLNHVSGSFAGIVGVYQRHSYADEKRAALEAYEVFLRNLLDGSPAETNVVSLADARVK